jgi:DNA-directed RNA polymerase subunit beta'
VIVGRLIPAGTGAVMNRLRSIAAGRDQRHLGNTTPALPNRAAE